MKKIFVLALAIFSLQSFAGIIQSRPSSDVLDLTIDQENAEVVVKGLLDGAQVDSRIPLVRHTETMNEAQVSIHEVGFFGLPFGRVQDGVRILKEEELKNPLLIASLMTLTLTLDVMGLPFDLIDGGLKNLAINKDIRILSKAIETENYQRNVSQRRLNRIIGYLGL